MPEDYYTVPIGRAEVVREGEDLTVLCYGTMVHVAQAAAERVQADAEIVDVRTLAPLDVPTIVRSVEKTGRCVVVHEATRFSGYGAELAATVQEQVLLSSGGADRACVRLGHAVSARIRVGVLSRSETCGCGVRAGARGMSEYVFKLPDLGEGTVEAEIVEWHVRPGDDVQEGQIIADVMTDKANVEVPAPVSGRVLRTSGEPGDVVAVGSELIAFAIAGEGTAASAVREADAPGERATEAAPEPESSPAATEVPTAPPEPAAHDDSDVPPPPAAAQGKVITSPAIRRQAKEANVDLSLVPGTGPRGRILRRDLDAYMTAGERTAARPPAPTRHPGGAEFDTQKVIGVRRVIAERMTQSKREIPHFAYVEEVDVSELERLRAHLNESHGVRLSPLPFIAIALMRALESFPQCNAVYDAQANVIKRYAPVHLGIATQTPDGLKVPVVKNADSMDLWRLTDAIAAAAQAARDGTASRDQLTGSTITLTSLGRLGGIVTTPVINYPEVGIIGVNKAVPRPVVVDGAVTVRTMMNLSSSFDHRFVDGYDAAALIQQVKASLEHPATMFLPPQQRPSRPS